ncbi:MAG: sulfatase-like hydrolase/transferase [Acidobacteriota bacterium]
MFVAMYVVLANVPYWIVAHEFGLDSRIGYFCVQYAAVGLIALVAPRSIPSILLFGAMLIDLLAGITDTFNLPVTVCLSNLSAAYDFTGIHLFWAITAGLGVLFATAGAALLSGSNLSPHERRRAAAFLIVISSVGLGADSLSIFARTGHIPRFSAASQDGIGSELSGIHHVTRLPILRLVRQEESLSRHSLFDNIEVTSASPMRSATDVAIRNAEILRGAPNSKLPNLVLVIVESWGLAYDDAFNAAMVEPYVQPAMTARYNVIRGSVPFNGPTVYGQARELCDSSFGFHLLIASRTELRSCLPATLAALGYSTMAVHGMSGHMFNRSVWYRTIGFQESWFHSQLRRQGLRDCPGAFVGTCDADIAAWIGQRLGTQPSRPQFIHWMTLSSHLPVNVPTNLPAGAPCSASLGLHADTALCSWYQLIVNVQRSVAEIALNPSGRPTVFVIVGDHAPPFADPAVQQRFRPSEVPYLVLLPRTDRKQAQSTILRAAAPRKARGIRPVPSKGEVRTVRKQARAVSG